MDYAETGIPCDFVISHPKTWKKLHHLMCMGSRKEPIGGNQNPIYSSHSGCSIMTDWHSLTERKGGCSRKGVKEVIAGRETGSQSGKKCGEYFVVYTLYTLNSHNDKC